MGGMSNFRREPDSQSSWVSPVVEDRSVGGCCRSVRQDVPLAKRFGKTGRYDLSFERIYVNVESGIV